MIEFSNSQLGVQKNTEQKDIKSPNINYNPTTRHIKGELDADLYESNAAKENKNNLAKTAKEIISGLSEKINEFSGVKKIYDKETGKLTQTISEVNGLIEEKIYDQNTGKVAREVFYDPYSNKKDKEFIYDNDNGIVERISYDDNGSKYLEDFYHSDTRKNIKRIFYENGKKSSEAFYDTDTNKQTKLIAYRTNGKKNTKYKELTYDKETGNITKNILYDKDELKTKETHFDPVTGTKIREIAYNLYADEEDAKDSEILYSPATGQKVQENSYEKGIKSKEYYFNQDTGKIARCVIFAEDGITKSEEQICDKYGDIEEVICYDDKGAIKSRHIVN